MWIKEQARPADPRRIQHSPAKPAGIIPNRRR
jgi:hypothetical protein